MTITILQYVAAILMICGSVFSLLAAVGILRLPDLYTRMHAASKAGTMGAGLLFAAIAVVALDGSVLLRAIAGFAFLLLTAPVSAHLLARAAYLAGYSPSELTKINDLETSINKTKK
ncbi:monovalent cation/H(+) antiporter subunit G [Mariluticola halotolerans]|uniref:monovalent cation/H(+) antiporter subunit G n=1 Tax=Mariluticola halotolerans TaxID=2909283 RepID=UPI0026E17E8D|nr:monovalent cation/H(+) antiporter subunit G [Mariluticola halotolerans]UJQ95760.1 monovalent cation/H(+) antiporter subunit G [Mariluticola halotolerans]